MIEELMKLVGKIKENGNLEEADIQEFQKNFDKEKFQNFMTNELPKLTEELEKQKAEEEAKNNTEEQIVEIRAIQEEPKEDPIEEPKEEPKPKRKPKAKKTKKE